MNLKIFYIIVNMLKQAIIEIYEKKSLFGLAGVVWRIQEVKEDEQMYRKAWNVVYDIDWSYVEGA